MKTPNFLMWFKNGLKAPKAPSPMYNKRVGIKKALQEVACCFLLQGIFIYHWAYL